MYRRCIDCGKEFWYESHEKWKIRCLHCFKTHKGTNKDNDKIQRHYDALVKKYNELAKNINKNMNFLIFACHPDRNPSRQQEATQVTQWLLELRDTW